MDRLAPELIGLLARHVRYPTDQEKKADPGLERACQGDVLSMMKTCKLLHGSCETLLYTDPIIDNLSLFLGGQDDVVKQKRWEAVKSVRLWTKPAAVPPDAYQSDEAESVWRGFIDRERAVTLPDLFPQLETTVVGDRNLRYWAHEEPDPLRSVRNGLDPRQLLEWSARGDYCQSAHPASSLPNGPLSNFGPDPPRTVTLHLPPYDPEYHQFVFPAIIIGSHNRHVYITPPVAGKNGIPMMSILLKLGVLQSFIDVAVRMCSAFTGMEVSRADLATTQVEVFGWFCPSDFDQQPHGLGFIGGLTSLDAAQKELDRMSGEWAGIIKLRYLRDTPPCPACGIQVGDSLEVEAVKVGRR